jgi:hypothetical protein
MAVRYRLVVDCADRDRLARVWAGALGYELAPVPAGFATWNFYRDLGVPEDEMVDGADRISDPAEQEPSIWFHRVPDTRTVKTSDARVQAITSYAGNRRTAGSFRTQLIHATREGVSVRLVDGLPVGSALLWWAERRPKRIVKVAGDG